MSRVFSYWEFQHYLSHIDVCIIGSGIVGLNAGIELLEKKPGLKVLIIERSYIPYGASTRNAGFACFGTASELLSELETSSEEEVFGLFAQRYSGIQELLKRVPADSMNYEKYGGNEAFANNNIPSEEQLHYLNTRINEYIGIQNYFQFDKSRLKDSSLLNFSALIHNEHEACINPMMMIDVLQRKFQNLGGLILSNAELSHWKDIESHVELHINQSYKTQSKKIIFATNGFAQIQFPQIDIKAARNQVMVIEANHPIILKGCYHYNMGYVYFRSVDRKLLIGGGRHIDKESEFTDSMEINPTIKSYLLEFVKEHILPDENFRIINHWVGILGLGTHRSPVIEKISENCIIAVRLSGIGVAIGTIVGKKAALIALQS
ncbi:MAG: FAD-binding oxidoreductase [Saprospiraceae bacterium]|nr:FAD-binding oxidoreductase [Saprospiraceae bacterium]